MTPQERLALALQYQKQRQELGSTLPDMNRAPTGAEPEQSWLDKLSEAASGAGYGLASQVEGIGQMARHPLDTLHSMAVGAGKAMDNPAAAGTAVVQGLKDAASQAVSSPFNMGRAVGAIVSVNPRKLAAMLESPMVREMTVYHGTPHQFPATEANPLGEFDASKIGTGEGAQAYGHGIYLAESPDVAKTYQSAQNPSARKATMTLQAFDGNVNKAIAAMKKEVATMTPHKDSPYLRQGAFQETQDALNYLQQMKKGAAPQTGALYTADLPDEHIERMLDWDKPFLDQSNEIKKVAKENLPASVYNQLLTQRTGDMVGELAGYKGGNAKASELMRQAGIPGIKYLDAGSRGPKGTGTRNFVIFPGEEKNLRILERNGQSLADALRK